MAKPATKPDAGVEYFPEVEQGGPEWIALRLGIPTASNFSVIMAEGKDGDMAATRRVYMHKLAGEILTGKPAEGKFKTASMERGHEMEPLARQHYERTNLVAVERIGFARRLLPSGRYMGASPDGMMDKRRKALEIKSQAPHIMIAALEKGAAGFPPVHRWQVYGTMLVCGIDEVDLQLFYEGMPVAPKFTIERHDKTIQELSNAIEIFDHELWNLVKKIKAMGQNR